MKLSHYRVFRVAAALARGLRFRWRTAALFVALVVVWFGTPLAEADEATALRASITATFTQAPSAHDGSNGFELHMEFSHEPVPEFSYRTVREALFDVEGGRITRVWRRERGKNRQ